MKRHLLIHYGEIGLKRGNMPYFLEKLKRALTLKLSAKFKGDFKVRYVLGRFFLELPTKFKEEDYVSVLKKIPGIRNFQFIYEGSSDYKKLGKQILKNLMKEGFLENKPQNFCVSVKRSMKMNNTSEDLEREIGSILIESGFDVKVKLKNPEFTVYVEFFNEMAFYSFKKYQGLGGYPTGSQSRLVALISTGIDSPVAAYKMMRRGARVIFVHFHAYPYTTMEEMDHVKGLVKILSEYQFDTKLFMIPFADFQKSIVKNLEINPKYRVIMYRRMMFRLAEIICRREDANGMITGDSLGQVASQTAENILAIQEVTGVPVFQPLIADDKEDIVKDAIALGTYEISKLPCKDTCSMFTPEHPVLDAKLRDVYDFEKKLSVQKWTRELLLQAETFKF